MVVGGRGEYLLLSSESVQRIAKHHMNQNKAVFSKAHKARRFFKEFSSYLATFTHTQILEKKLNTVLILCIYTYRGARPLKIWHLFWMYKP